MTSVKDLLPFSQPNIDWPDERLVESCLAGNQVAWAALITKYKRLIYAIPFRHGAKAEDAADIFQLVCIELYDELPRLRKVESLRSWLITVAARLSLKWRLRKLRNEGDDYDWDQAIDYNSLGSEAWHAQAERAQMIDQAISRLNERCQNMIRRLFFDDPPLAYDELARQMGLATGSIGFTRGRCLDKLRKELMELGL
jgi:RNA polymerase sigma factor (sigma-70 family)